MNILLNYENFYRTSDLFLCVALCYCGYAIEAIEKNDSSRAVFIYKRDENIDEVVQQYFKHELRVEPISFSNYLKEVKTRLYNHDK